MYSGASTEPLDVIEAEECHSQADSVYTRRVRRLFNELRESQNARVDWFHKFEEADTERERLLAVVDRAKDMLRNWSPEYVAELDAMTGPVAPAPERLVWRLRGAIGRAYLRLQCADVPRGPWHDEVSGNLLEVADDPGAADQQEGGQ